MKTLLALLMLLLLACEAQARAAPPLLPLREPAPPVLPRTTLGVNSHLASRHGDCSQLDGPATLLAEAGVGWAREDVQFSAIAPVPEQSGWNWRCLDAAVAALTSRNIAVLGVLGGPSPGWAVGLPEEAQSRLAPDAAAFAAFAGAAAARYRGRVAAWQIWNEPDNARYWGPAPDPAAYTALLRAASEAIRAADPAATVVLGGLVSPDPARGFLEAVHAAGGWDAFDVVAANPYADPWGPESGQIGTVGVGAVRALVDRLGPKPVWATEFGWSTGPADRTNGGGEPVSEETQASYLLRSMALVQAAGAQRVFWYSLKDTDPANNLYGLVRYGAGSTDFGPAQHKAALAALRALGTASADAGGAELSVLGTTSVVADFESFTPWARGDQPNGELTQSTERQHGGAAAARLDYSFPTAQNDFVVFLPQPETPLPGLPTIVSLWVAGDGSGNELKAWFKDSAGEVLQFRLGPVGGAEWSLLATPIDGVVEPWNQVTAGVGEGGTNRRLDGPISLLAIGLDDAADSFVGAGTIFLDDLSSVEGAAYQVRLRRGEEAVDVLWALGPTEATLPTKSAEGRLVDRTGGVATITPVEGAFRLTLGPSPLILTHRP